jgi:four helix bundle protein
MRRDYDLDRRTFRFATLVHDFAREVYDRGGLSRRVATQLLDAGSSVGANIEESVGAQTKADFIAKLSIARKEAFESRYWLRLVAHTHADLRDRAGQFFTQAPDAVVAARAARRRACGAPPRAPRAWRAARGRCAARRPAVRVRRRRPGWR